jgi:tRNA U34 5-carboxymethylaminomethyl modifying enzyme MnmG/GidA
LTFSELDDHQLEDTKSYEFLLLFLQGIAQKWHLDSQVFVASLSLLTKYQEKKDEKENSNQESTELKELLVKASELLCYIEHFVNVTSNRGGQNKISWYNKVEMSNLVKFKRRDHLINNIFVKARFQNYIERLEKRLEHFKLEKNLLLVKALKPHRSGSHQMRKNRKNKQNRRRTTVDTVDESKPTPKMFIVTTSKKPRRSTKVSRSPKRQNKINQKLE